ncbi:MAG TPA: polysaccharide lyase family 8 super-sandwich domain-containing protein [Chitinophagaceae bacterium]|nr:polysaccharide lyase family 8 super-sandwich domain-containing protein [Chitinophagaceae bacterium]
MFNLKWTYQMLTATHFRSGLVILLFSFHLAHAQVDTVLNRYRQYLINTVAPENDPARMLATLTANYQWPDLNYADTARAFWQNLSHIRRVRDLALSWANPHSAFYQNENVKQSIHGGLGLWLKHRYKNANWWHNEIGVPLAMRDIIVLFEKQLSPAEREGALQVLAQYKLQKPGAGANLTWTADLGLHYGAFTGNEELMNTCRQLMIDEIHITTADGVQPDYSFHQHSARLQMYQYGAAFLKGNARIAWQLRETKWAYPPDKIKLLVDFALDGWQWMARGIYTVPGTIDRSCSRRDALSNADLRDLLPYLSQLDPEKSGEFTHMLFRQNDSGTALIGFRYYPYSDFSVYQQKDFGFFLKTISLRTLETESINSENLKGQLLNSGDGYTIRNGKEYFNLMPNWDWDLLPGLTSFKGANTIIRKQFAGSVSDSMSGFTSMDYGLGDNKGRAFNARKSWFCHAGLVVCLVVETDSNKNEENIFTAIDQSRWQGDVLVNNQKSPLKEGHHTFNKLRWLHHSGIGYIFLDPAVLTLDLKKVTGSWKSINASETDQPVHDDLFVPVLMHQQKKNIGYVIAAGRSPNETRTLASNPNWKIIRNDKDCQAVSFADGTTMISFFSPGTLEFNKHKISVDQPCLILMKKGKLFLSNPMHDKRTVNIKYNQSNANITMPDNGYSIYVQQLVTSK